MLFAISAKIVLEDQPKISQSYPGEGMKSVSVQEEKMKTSRVAALFLILILTACQASPAVVTPTLPAATGAVTSTAPAKTRPAPTSTPSPVPTPVMPTSTVVPTPIDFTTQVGQLIADVKLTTYQAVPYTGKLDALPISLGQIGNPAVIKGLTAQQKQFLSQNGFVVIQAGDTQFKDLRDSISESQGQPYYLTTDAAYHALHQTFDDMLVLVEREYMHAVLGRLLKAEFDKVNDYAAAASGAPLAKDIELSINYLAVAIKLLYPDQQLAPQVEQAIAPQIDQIMAYGGTQDSVLIPGLSDDYGAYRPVGHYAGIPDLENYFRSMTWLGRVAFSLKASGQQNQVSRAPLIMTLALREASVDDVPAYQVWSELSRLIDFLVGPSDDPGPVELNALMEMVYGKTFSLIDLADEGKWSTFLKKVDELPAPQINSTFASSSAAQAASRDWRFMGQRFTLDSFIFQNLIYDAVGTQDKPREFPSGLDVAAAFGSQPALQALDAAGATQYANYSAQMSAVQKIVNNQPENQWLNRFYTAWLYAFKPQVSAKDTNFPPYMRTAAWGYKEVNSMLGSWAELKHDTVLYAKMPEARGGGGPPGSPAAPAYVEPNPDTFYRLAFAATSLYDGLSSYIDEWNKQKWFENIPDGPGSEMDTIIYFDSLKYLSEKFQALGGVAGRELQGQPLTSDDFGMISSCIGIKECLSRPYEQVKMDPIPVIAAVSGAKDEVLEAGVGNLDRIYVAVPLEGKLEIAQGNVFTYYEFTQPRNNRLTDQDWRDMLAKNPPAAPAWISQFVLLGGSPTDVLAFRIGDVYIMDLEDVNLRAGPSTSDKVLRVIDKGSYLTITDGPVVNSEATWWKIKIYDWSAASPGPIEGWVMGNPAWFSRSP